VKYVAYKLIIKFNKFSSFQKKKKKNLLKLTGDEPGETSSTFIQITFNHLNFLYPLHFLRHSFQEDTKIAQKHTVTLQVCFGLEQSAAYSHTEKWKEADFN
jgi:hypothetical protein